MFAAALETSGRVGSIAVFRDGNLIEEQSYPHGLQHAAAIVPMLDQLCREHEISPKALAQIYVSVGPGSFTGLRVGITLAKTFAWSTGARIVAVPSTAAIIENLPLAAREGIVVLDAKRGQIFTARYRRELNDSWSCVESARLDTLAGMLSRAGRPVYLIGEGIPYHPLTGDEGEGVVVTDESVWTPRAEAVGRLGMAMANRGQFTDTLKLVPIYVRLAEAEEKRLISEGKLNRDGTPLT